MADTEATLYQSKISESMLEKLRLYYYLTKPGIVYSNVASALSGYLFACRFNIDLIKLLALLFGLTFVIASSCVANNILDMTIDAKMKRTKNRALVINKISRVSAVNYTVILGIVGLLLLLKTNSITASICEIAVIWYVVIYGYFKRTTKYGTLVGSVSGSASLVAGYTLASGKLDKTALLLFLIMVSWQMSHFYSIAIRRLKEYSAANLPVWPAVKGIKKTKRQIILFTALFAESNLLLFYSKKVGAVYITILLFGSILWLRDGYKLNVKDSESSAKRLFFDSIKILMLFMIMLPLSTVLP